MFQLDALVLLRVNVANKTLIGVHLTMHLMHPN